MQVGSPLCVHQFSEHVNIPLYALTGIFVLVIGCIHQTPYLVHVILILVISISHSSIKLYCINHYFGTVSVQFEHVIIWSFNLVIINIQYPYYAHILLLFYFVLSYMLILCLLHLASSISSSSDVYTVLHLLEMQVHVLTIKSHFRLVPSLQFSSITGKSSK